MVFTLASGKPRRCCRVAVNTHSRPARDGADSGLGRGASWATMSSDKGVAEGTTKPCGGLVQLPRQDGVKSLKVDCWREWAGSAEDHVVGKT